MLDIVHAASFWMLFLWWERRLGKTDSAPESITICVCSSVPVTIFPMALNEGVWNKHENRKIGIMESVFEYSHTWCPYAQACPVNSMICYYWWVLTSFSILQVDIKHTRTANLPRPIYKQLLIIELRKIIFQVLMQLYYMAILVCTEPISKYSP